MSEKIINATSYTLKDLDRAAEVASFYGFMPIKTPKITREDIEKVDVLDGNRRSSSSHCDIFPRPEEKIAFLRRSMECSLIDDPTYPTMIYYKRPFPGSGERSSSHEYHCGLDIVGSTSSICEAVAIRTTSAILADHGYTNLMVNINSIGDKESILRYESELSTFIRKNAEYIPAPYKQIFRKNPFEAVICDEKEWSEVRERLPQAMSHLSEASITNFKEILEHLESLDVPYRIVHNLVGDRSFCSHTIFEIRDASEGENAALFAVGTRHNHITKRIGLKRDIPIMSVNIRFKKPVSKPKLVFNGKIGPKFYFIQFGTRAKHKSLSVIEILRQARIPVHHSLMSDQFVGQLHKAESVGSQFVIIMGQKEAIENTVVVRHSSTRVQETVPISDLVRHLSRLR